MRTPLQLQTVGYADILPVFQRLDIIVPHRVQRIDAGYCYR